MATMEKVDPFVVDRHGVGFRSCEFCEESAVKDIRAGRANEADWRTFYVLTPGGCCVCSDCLATLGKDDFA